MAHALQAMLDAALLGPAGAYASDGITFLTTAVEKRGNGFINTLRITQLNMEALGSPFDLVSADPTGADDVGIPANFGPGRGNWVEDDLARLLVEIRGATGVAHIVSIPANDSDIVITFVDTMNQPPPGMEVVITYVHSIQL